MRDISMNTTQSIQSSCSHSHVVFTAVLGWGG